MRQTLEAMIDQTKPPELAPALEVCWRLHKAGREVPKVVAEGVPGIISGTAVRASDTYQAILYLVAASLTQQASMLLRSLFEDMAVMHWLLLHPEDQLHYAQRFLDHRDAMALVAERVAREVGWPTEQDVTAIRDREPMLLADFGRYAERAWWDKDGDGERVTLARIVEDVGSAEQFWGRTHGETKILEQHFNIVNKWANQILHHTAVGLGAVRVSDNEVALDVPRAAQVLAPAYYCYAMVECAVVELGGTVPQHSPIWPIFMDGLPVLLALAQAEQPAREAG